jgi:hypothetical protein
MRICCSRLTKFTILFNIIFISSVFFIYPNLNFQQVVEFRPNIEAIDDLLKPENEQPSIRKLKETYQTIQERRELR